MNPSSPHSEGMRNALIAALVAVSMVALPTNAAGATSKAARAAKRDAVHRLDTAPLPPRTHPVPLLPKPFNLPGPPFESVTPDIVDVHSFFVTALGRNRAFAWFKSHPPPKAGASRLLSRGVARPSRILGFRWGDSRLVEERTLYVTVISRPSGGAAIRIDSQATWGDKGAIA